MKRILNINLFFLAGLLFFSSCNEETAPAQEAEQEQEAGHGEEENPNVAELTAEQYRVAGIALGKPEMRNLSKGLTVTGQLEVPPQSTASVSAPMGGFVKSTSLLEGERVKKGQLIARIENPDFVTLQQDYLEAKSRLGFMEQEYQRQKELAEEQVTAAKTFQQTTAEYRSLQARVQGLEEKLRIIGINPGSLRAGGISRILPIYAPIDGYVTFINASVGQYVAPTDVLFRIADTDKMFVELTVFEKDVAALKVGQPVWYALPNEQAAQRVATIRLIGKEISQERTIQVLAQMKEQDKELTPGMFVKANVELNGQQVLALPETAVVQDAGNDYIFLFTGEEKEGEAVMKRFRMVPIEKGVAESGYVQVALPANVDTASANFVTKGAYSLLSKMRNSEDEGGHH
ncbi:efflux RND transporter periplasmic adaptor subunit [Rufibacter immobilis]|uniref:efflux RND transporter periplasmic adaptor subunit n=1 Tax=Rufibacter immobilis TaxID=1348778 RepID=UPI0035EE5A8B